MSTASHKTSHARGIACEFRVRGTLGPTLLQAFPQLSASPAGAVTTLRGELADQAAMHGVLLTMSDLGLELLSMQRLDVIDRDPDPSAARGSWGPRSVDRPRDELPGSDQ